MSQQDGSNCGSQNMFYGEIWLIILKYPFYPFLSGALYFPGQWQSWKGCHYLEKHLEHQTQEKLIQYNFNGSNTDGSFTMAVSNSFLSPLENKSTASGAKYARSSVIFPHHMTFVWGGSCSDEGAKTKSDKYLGKGGGGITLQL